MSTPSTPDTTPTGNRAHRRSAGRRRTRLAAACAALATALTVFTPMQAGAGTLDETSALGGGTGEDPNREEEPDGGDPSTPAVALPAVIGDLESLLARTPSTDAARQAALRAAIAELRAAIAEHTGDSPDLDAVAAALGRAVTQLAAVRPADDAEARSLHAGGAGVAGVARAMAVRVVDVADRAGAGEAADLARRHLAAGDELVAAGDFPGGVESYSEALAPKDGVVFSMDLFERNLRAAVGPFVSGYAYTINQAGQIAREGAGGWARTSADLPATPHSPTREQTLASVSKTITGVAMLRALQDTNVPLDTPINAFLPANWVRGPNAGQITFRHLLTHTSGICPPNLASCPGPGNVSSAWAGMRTRISQSFSFPAAYDYENANFGLMRILLPRVRNNVGGVTRAMADFLWATDAARAQVHAASFESYVRSQVFAPMGIDGRCSSSELVPTLMYLFPHAGQPGWNEPSNLLGCGGYGWVLSSRDLGAFMAYLRYTTTVLSADTRTAMDTGFLGWADPTQWSWSNGAFGTYLAHGGDWTRPGGQSHTCIMKFNINVEVSLVINSQETFTGHQCTVLRNAFDQAWIAA